MSENQHKRSDQSNKSPQLTPPAVNFSRLAEKLKRSGVPHRKIGSPLVGPLAEVAAGGYIMHSGVSPSSQPPPSPTPYPSPSPFRSQNSDWQKGLTNDQ